MDAGTCFVNTYNKTDVAAPFGGFKQSGFGKDLGRLVSVMEPMEPRKSLKAVALLHLGFVLSSSLKVLINYI